MGKKYIVEIGRLERLYKAFINGNGKPNLTWLSPEVDLTPYTEPDMEQVRKEAYEEGLSDAWEAARKIYLPEDHGGLGYDMLMKIFNTDNKGWLFKNLSASEAIEKIRRYEQEEKEQIQVGDEVIRHYKNEFMEGDDAPSIFLSEEDGHFRCLAFNGRSIMIAEYPKNQYRKTGRHFHEIAAVLQKMKES